MAINLFLSILEISISVGLIVLVLILLSPFLNKRYAAKWKYWIWLFLALRLITPVGGTDIRRMFLDKVVLIPYTLHQHKHVFLAVGV